MDDAWFRIFPRVRTKRGEGSVFVYVRYVCILSFGRVEGGMMMRMEDVRGER